MIREKIAPTIIFGILVGILLVVTGCSIFERAVDGRVVSAATRYCEETDYQRDYYRAAVNEALGEEGIVVHVHCPGELIDH